MTRLRAWFAYREIPLSELPTRIARVQHGVKPPRVVFATPASRVRLSMVYRVLPGLERKRA
jgi:hypothetical protein